MENILEYTVLISTQENLGAESCKIDSKLPESTTTTKHHTSASYSLPSLKQLDHSVVKEVSPDYSRYEPRIVSK